MKQRMLVLAVGLACMLAGGLESISSAASIDVFQIGFWAGDYWYDKTPATDGTMSVNIAEGDCVAYIEAGGVPYVTFCSFQLTPAKMDTDTSSGNIAQASFFDNYLGVKSTLTVTGELNGFSGTLLTAEVADSFTAVETDDFGGMTIIDVHQDFLLTGGDLLTGAQTGLTLWNQFTAIYTFDTCSSDQYPGEVRDFQSSIEYTIGNTNVQLVPEPFSLLILAAGLLGVRCRRKA